MPTNNRKYMREYMKKARKLGKIKHWRQYLKEKQNEKKEDIYSNIDEMLSSTLDDEDNK